MLLQLGCVVMHGMLMQQRRWNLAPRMGGSYASRGGSGPTGADVRYVLTVQGVEALCPRVALTPRGAAWLRWYAAARSAGLDDDQAQAMGWRAAERAAALPH